MNKIRKHIDPPTHNHQQITNKPTSNISPFTMDNAFLLVVMLALLVIASAEADPTSVYIPDGDIGSA